MIANVAGDVALVVIIVFAAPAAVIINGAARGIVSGIREARAYWREHADDEV